jgi:hypothetical protein
MSARAGGEAAKFGERYEGQWTVARLLDVLAGARPRSSLKTKKHWPRALSSRYGAMLSRDRADDVGRCLQLIVVRRLTRRS